MGWWSSGVGRWGLVVDVFSDDDVVDAVPKAKPSLICWAFGILGIHEPSDVLLETDDLIDTQVLDVRFCRVRVKGEFEVLSVDCCEQCMHRLTSLVCCVFIM